MISFSVWLMMHLYKVLECCKGRKGHPLRPGWNGANKHAVNTLLAICVATFVA